MAKAVIIKGPTPESSSYITMLPDSMEALLQKAKDLFCVPSNHTPHFTLGDDSNVIVLPDFLPLLREREVLIFRWTPDTPRSSLRRSTGQSVVEYQDAVNTGSRATSHTEESSNDLSKSARGVRWDESVVSNEEKNKRHIPRPRSLKENRDSAASRQRAEYARQKIQEQEELRQRETAVQAETPTEDATTSDDPFVSLTRTETASTEIQATPTDASSKLTQEDLLVSGSSPPSYTSPTPKSASQSDEEQQNSSPMASPTRDVRGARKTNHSKSWLISLGTEKNLQAEETDASDSVKESTESAVEPKSNDAESEKEKEAAPVVVDDVMEETAAPEDTKVEVQESMLSAAEVDDLEEQAVEQATSPLRVQEVNLRDVPAYQTMKSVVNQLRSHPSNQWFRQPCPDDMQRFCEERNRPVVDLFTISDSITLGRYGMEDPLKHFKSNLDQMWNNIRTFYAPQSHQSQCATILETFSGILLEEWKRNSLAAARTIKPRPNVPRPYSTPMSRGEKRNIKPGQDSTPKTQQQAYFASLVAKTGLAPSTSPSRMLNKLGQKRPASTFQLQRPAKKAQVLMQTVTPSQSPAINVTAQDSTDITKVLPAVPSPNPRVMTRGIARRSVA